VNSLGTRKHKIVMISVNDTQTPTSGGEYTYRVIKDESLRQGYQVQEVSVPILLRSLLGSKSDEAPTQNVIRSLLYFRCLFESLDRRWQRGCLVITSSSPLFPVFGHLVYHQPKTGICCTMGREYLSLYEQLGMLIHENENLSPVWLFAKRSHILHLSNSYFTKGLISDLYGLESLVLYPPVSIPCRHSISSGKERVPGVIIVRPRAISGITFLPRIIDELPKTVKFVVIGKADAVGMEVFRFLRSKGVDIKYLGYVSESMKLDLFTRFSHYLHLGLNESFGITVVEAMAAGCIPVAPKSGAIPEYVPKDLLYSNHQEASQKISSQIGLGDSDLEMELKNIAKRFDEKKFRRGIAAYINMLDTKDLQHIN